MFVFDDEVVVVLEMLVGKTLEQGLIEVNLTFKTCGFLELLSSPFHRNQIIARFFKDLFHVSDDSILNFRLSTRKKSLQLLGKRFQVNKER